MTSSNFTFDLTNPDFNGDENITLTVSYYFDSLTGLTSVEQLRFSTTDSVVSFTSSNVFTSDRLLELAQKLKTFEDQQKTIQEEKTKYKQLELDLNG